jgi:Lipid II flippase MurJ
VVALAVGFVVGSAARLGAQLVPLRRLGVRLVPVLDLRDPGFRTITRLVPPLLLGSAVGNVNTLVDRAVASVPGEGRSRRCPTAGGWCRWPTGWSWPPLSRRCTRPSGQPLCLPAERSCAGWWGVG